MTMQEMLDSCVDPNERKRIYSIEPIEQSEPYFFDKMKHSYIHISKRVSPQKQEERLESLHELMKDLSILSAVGNRQHL